MSTPRVVYVVFDRYPAPKGAAIHIGAFAQALASAFAPVALLTVGDELVSAAGPTLEHHTLPAAGRNILARAAAYRTSIAQWFARRRVDVIHFRSIFEGYPLAQHKSELCEKLVFEVNGLPSIELKYHYPKVAEDRELLAKLRAQEQTCIAAADLIITVSDITRAHLIARGAHAAKIRVIPNGVDLSIFPYHCPPRWSKQMARKDSVIQSMGLAPAGPSDSASTLHSDQPMPLRLLYSGTLASWQGVYRAIEALELIRKDHPAILALVGPASQQRREELIQRCQELGITPHVQFLDPVDQSALCQLHHQADIALAPLLRNDRNIAQGCCPLKILEAMAAGTPLVASDLPVASALARHEREALLVRPGSAKSIKDAVLRLTREPELAIRLSRAARRRVEEEFTWEIAAASLIKAYEEVLEITPSRILESTAASMRG